MPIADTSAAIKTVEAAAFAASKAPRTLEAMAEKAMLVRE
jgi:hypothetical protein